jgi:hypothetical protein
MSYCNGVQKGLKLLKRVCFFEPQKDTSLLKNKRPNKTVVVLFVTVLDFIKNAF